MMNLKPRNARVSKKRKAYRKPKIKSIDLKKLNDSINQDSKGATSSPMPDYNPSRWKQSKSFSRGGYYT